MAEVIQFSRVKEFPELETYQVVNAAQSVSRHIHWVFSLSVCQSGIGVHETKQGKYDVIPGSIFVINSGETHSKWVPNGYTYSSCSIRIEPMFLDTLITQISGQQLGTLHFQQPAIYNWALAQQIISLYKTLEDHTSRLEKQCLLLDTLAKLYTGYSCERVKLPVTGHERAPILRACEYLQDCSNENVSLSQLASIAGLSEFHLSRVFTKEIGVPPHTYQLQVRLKKATDLIASGKTLVEASLETGFYDQSHFQKAFKKKFGVTPGQYKW